MAIDFKIGLTIGGVAVVAGYPALAGLTSGRVLRATSGTSVAFAAIQASDLPSNVAYRDSDNQFSAAQGIRSAIGSSAAGLYVPWVSGDTLPTVKVGSLNSGNVQTGVYALSYGGAGLWGVTYSGTPVIAERSDGDTSSAPAIISLRHNTSNTPVAGFGAGILFLMQTTTTPNQLAAQIGAAWSDPANATRSAYLSFQTVNSAGTLTERMRLSSAGNLGIGTTDTPGEMIYAVRSLAAQIRVASTSSGGSTLMSYGSAAQGESVYLSANQTYSAGAWSQINTGYASWLEVFGQSAGDLWGIFRTAAGGTPNTTQILKADNAGNVFANGNFYPAGNTDCYYGRWGASTPFISGNVVTGGSVYPGNQGSYAFGYWTSNWLRCVAANLTVDGVVSAGLQSSYYMGYSSNIYSTGYAGSYFNGALGVTGELIINNGNWIRINASGGTQAGVYWQQYGGGISMADTTWVRVYNSKQFLVNNLVQIDYANASLILNNTGGTGLRTNIRFLSSGGGKWQIGSDYDLSGGQSLYFYDEVAAAHRMIIGSLGGVQIGYRLYIGAIGGSPSYLIHLASDSAGKPNGGSWTNSSDRRLKIDHGAYTRGLSDLRRLQPVLFEFNGKNGTPRDGVHAGFMAQDVREIVPEMVSTIPGEIDGLPTDILQLNLSDLPLILRNAVVALADRVQQLEYDIAALRNNEGDHDATTVHHAPGELNPRVGAPDAPDRQPGRAGDRRHRPARAAVGGQSARGAD